MAIDHVAEMGRGKREGLIPAHAPPAVALAYHRLGDAIGGADIFERVPSFHAQVAFADGRVPDGTNGDDRVGPSANR